MAPTVCDTFDLCKLSLIGRTSFEVEIGVQIVPAMLIMIFWKVFLSDIGAVAMLL